MPLAGISCKFTTMLMQPCRPNSMARPAVAKRQKGSSLRAADNRLRTTMKANNAASAMQTMTPNSSPITAKI